MLRFSLKTTLVFTFLILTNVVLIAQEWIQIPIEQIESLGKKDIVPNRYEVHYSEDNNVKSILWSTPFREKKTATPSLVRLPILDGQTDEFSIVRYHMMESELEAKYDNIRTYHGRSTTHPSRRVVIDYTVHGLRAVITDQNGQIYIDHFQRNDRDHKVIYRKSDFSPIGENWTCGTEALDIGVDPESPKRQLMVGDCSFRTYRHAQACTAEYSNYHGATSSAQSSLVMSAVTTTMNRVNGVYRQDVNLEMILVNNTDLLFYYNGNTDPYSGSSSNHLNQNQSNINSVIGNGNYDIGHVFDTGSGGVASLGSVCSNNNKAKGYTGRNTPTGDPFDIDYVAHEMGHQFGANHTQNNNCNRVTLAAREPGSASTIMGYAGICTPNVQNNSDAYFHGYSIQEIYNEINTTSCFQIDNSNTNGAPSITSISNKTIPKSTPFVLEASATDPNSDPLLYCWEQWDEEVGSMPPSANNTQGPMFRSITPTTNPKRYFPNLDDIVNGTSTQWEVLPSVGRSMDFRLTVKDMPTVGGCNDDTNVSITTSNSAGPFTVTSDNSGSISYDEGESITVTWDVANTNNSPVSCSNVDILLSYDGGYTYPTTWLANTSNDGSQLLTVPFGVSSQVRYMIKCSDNYFFDINDQDISIVATQPTFTLDISPNSSIGCGNDSFTVTISSTSIAGFSTPITLSGNGLPATSMVSFSPNPVIPGQNSTGTITNNGTASGPYSFSFDGIAGGTTKSVNYDMQITELSLPPNLLSPSDNEDYVELIPTLSWATIPGATSYNYELSDLPNGGNIIESGNTTGLTFTPTSELIRASKYYWRVNSQGDCGTSAWSSDFEFSTENCFTKTSANLPISLSNNGFISSDIELQENREILDINIKDISATHDDIGTLNWYVASPSTSSSVIIRSICSGSTAIDLSIDSEASSSNIPCPPTTGLSYQGMNSLSPIYGTMSRGTYSLSVEANITGMSGTLNHWEVDVCLSTDCDLIVTNTNPSGTGSLLAAIDCALNGDTILLDNTFDNQTFTINEEIWINKRITILATGSNITLISTNSSILNVDTEANLTLIGFDTESQDISVPCIDLKGKLTLIDMLVKTASNESITNQGGELNILGISTIE